MKYLIFLWLLYPLIESFIQSKLIARGWKPIYIMLFLIRGIVAIAHGALLDEFIGLSHWAGYFPGWQWVYVLVFQVCSFWIFFDLLLNLFRGKNWYYTGKESGWLDEIKDKDGRFDDFLYWGLKAIALAGMFLSLNLWFNY